MRWVLANTPVVGACLGVHLLQTLPAVLATLVLSVLLARLAQRVRPLRAVIASGSALLYAIPSLALFVILPIVLGTGIREIINVVVALTLYGLALLAPATVEALEAVDDGTRDAATAMGMGQVRRFWAVELPLAGPAILAGLRVVAVSTVSLTTVGAVLGVRSLGQLFTDGFERGVRAEILTGLVLMPWAGGGPRGRRPRAGAMRTDAAGSGSSPVAGPVETAERETAEAVGKGAEDA